MGCNPATSTTLLFSPVSYYPVIKQLHTVNSEEDTMNMKEIDEIRGLDETEANLICSKAMLKLKTQFTPASLKL